MNSREVELERKNEAIELEVKGGAYKLTNIGLHRDRARRDRER